MCSGYDQTNPRLPTRESKPSLSISTVCGRLVAIRRTSSASTTLTTVSPRSAHPDDARTARPDNVTEYADLTLQFAVSTSDCPPLDSWSIGRSRLWRWCPARQAATVAEVLGWESVSER